MAQKYDVQSKNLNDFLSQINDEHLKERYEMFFSLHERVHSQYTLDKNVLANELRSATEALCKLLIFVYVPKANDLFNEKDMLSHKYLKVIDKNSSDKDKIKEESLIATPGRNKYFEDKTYLGQLAYALLCKKGEKEDGKNMVYNTIKECHDRLYNPLNTNSSHAVPTNKQAIYTPHTLYSRYFEWVHSMIDICSDKLSPLNKLLPFENTPIEEHVKNDMELNQLMQEDETLNELNNLAKGFKHEFGRKYILVVSTTLKSELKASLAKIAWNMVIDFDPKTQEKGGLYSTIKEIWGEKRQMLYSEVETNGDKITYWVEANGNTTNTKPYSEEQLKDWRKKYIGEIVDNKIRKLNEQKQEGEIVFVDLYSQSEFPILLYTDRDFPENTTTIRILSSEEDMIAKNHNIVSNGEVKEYVIEQGKLTRYFDSLNGNILGKTSEFTSGCTDITAEKVNELTAYGIECVPVIPLSTEKMNLDAGFCSGKKITWEELYSGIDVKRHGYDNFYGKIANYIRNGKKFHACIKHQPCSGGTTVARRLAFDLMNKDTDVSSKCYVVFLSELKSTSNVVFGKLNKFIEDTLPSEKMLIIFIDRTISDEKIEELKKKCIQPTHNVSAVRVTYNSTSNTNTCLQINEGLVEERPDFNRLYANRKTDIYKLNLEKVIDFPLSLKDFDNFQSIDDYVKEWTKNIDQEYRDVFEHFSILTSVASLYVYDYDRYVSTGFTDSIFEKYGDIKTIWELYYRMSKPSKEAFEKLFDMEYNDEDKLTGRIRPRFSQFAQSFIHNSNLGIYDIAADYLEHVSKWDAIDKMKYVHDVFLKRPDFEMDELQKKANSLSEKVSSFFKDQKCDPETILKVYKLLVKYFPDDEDSLLSYSQFLYNKAYFVDKEAHDGKQFEESEQILSELIDTENGNVFNSLVYQSFGVLFYRKIGVLRSYLLHHTDNFTKKHYACVVRYCNLCSENCDNSTELDPTSAYGLVTKAQMLKAVLNITQKYKQYNDWTFCEEEENYKNMYLDYLDACSKIAKHVPEEENNTFTASDYNLINIFNTLDDFKKKLNGGNGEKYFDKYQKKYESAKDEKLKQIYAYRLYDTVISPKRQDIRASLDNLNDKCIRIIEEATKHNATHGISGAYEKLLNLVIFNNRTEWTIDDVIERILKVWEKSAKTNEEHLWINYYFMVFYAVQILNEGHANEGRMKLYKDACEKTKKYCKAADQENRDTYSYLYYKVQKSKDLDCITENKEKASDVQGTIIEVSKSNRKRGIAILDCGLNASFSAKDRKYDDVDINRTRLKGIIGFRFNGLGLYQQDIIAEPTDENIVNDTAQAEKIIEESNKEVEEEVPTKTVGPKVIGKVDLSQFTSSTQRQKKQLITGQRFEGAIIMNGSSKNIECEYYPYPLRIEGKCEEVYEDEIVSFEAQSRPNDKNTQKLYWYATDVKLKEE